jgi:dTDP-4-dehydrorhamnose reductase
MINILVTGGNGQLAKCIKDLELRYPNFNIYYTDFTDLDITKMEDLNNFFKKNPVEYCINCAAYTAVDKAENDQENAFKVNELGAKNLAIACKNYNSILIHISTDFVFDGTKTEPYTEEDSPNPINVYGASKLQGEKQIQKYLSNYFILRTSWLYSEHGNNFMKTMLRLANENSELKIVNDQIGSPTYAKDFASIILQLISTNNKQYGTYHYSNEGVTSWYDFAKAIFEEMGADVKLSSIK